MHAFSPENGVIKPMPVPAVERVQAFSPENGLIKPKPAPAVERVHAFIQENRVSSMWSKRVKEEVIADDSETHRQRIVLVITE